MAGHLFIKRTALKPTEQNTNFKLIDNDIISLISSDEAKEITGLMSFIYLRLVNAPTKYLDRDRVLQFNGEEREGKWITAWEQILGLTGVASATAQKAIAWMAKKGLIGYSAFKNGIGIRIYLNRAANSIKQKNLSTPHTSTRTDLTSQNDLLYKDSKAVSESILDNLNPPSQKSCTATEQSIDTKISSPPSSTTHSMDLTVALSYLSSAIQPRITQAAREVMASELKGQLEIWEKRLIPKAARVSQKEMFNSLRKEGLLKNTSWAEVGRNHSPKCEHIGPIDETDLELIESNLKIQAENHIQSLSPGEHEKLYIQVKSEALRNHTWIKTRNSEEQDQIFRGLMVKRVKQDLRVKHHALQT
jgi:hypothetical protein